MASAFSSTIDQSTATAIPSTAAKNRTVNNCVTAYPLDYPQAKTAAAENGFSLVNDASEGVSRQPHPRCDRGVDFGDRGD
jgi:hypothetical protein